MLVIILSFHEYVAAIDFPSHDITIRIGLPIRIGYRRMAFIDARFMQMGLSQVTGIWGLVLWLWMHLIQCHSVTIIILNFYQETWNILAFSVNSRHSMVIEVFPCGCQGTIWRYVKWFPGIHKERLQWPCYVVNWQKMPVYFMFPDKNSHQMVPWHPQGRSTIVKLGSPQIFTDKNE